MANELPGWCLKPSVPVAVSVSAAVATILATKMIMDVAMELLFPKLLWLYDVVDVCCYCCRCC